MDTSDPTFQQLADLPASGLESEEDVKNKVVLPLLRALGYHDSEFNYERRTGRGYVDVAIEDLPVAIVVEAKAPRTKLDQYVDQLENYVFHKHSYDRVATVAILTDGNWFRIYGVTESIRKGSLSRHEIIAPFKRSELTKVSILTRLDSLLGRESNATGNVVGAISQFQKETNAMRERLQAIETELNDLRAERSRIEARIQELQVEQELLTGTSAPIPKPNSPSEALAPLEHGSADDHILRLLRERGAHTQAHAVKRELLDSQLIGKVDSIGSNQALSFGLIRLKGSGQIDYDYVRVKKPSKKGNPPIKDVWLK